MEAEIPFISRRWEDPVTDKTELSQNKTDENWWGISMV
jgi:hypothetical protein